MKESIRLLLLFDLIIMFDDDVDDDACESTLFKEKEGISMCLYVYFGVVTTTGVVFQERYVGIV